MVTLLRVWVPQDAVRLPIFTVLYHGLDTFPTLPRCLHSWIALLFRLPFDSFAHHGVAWFNNTLPVHYDAFLGRLPLYHRCAHLHAYGFPFTSHALPRQHRIRVLASLPFTGWFSTHRVLIDIATLAPRAPLRALTTRARFAHAPPLRVACAVHLLPRFVCCLRCLASRFADVLPTCTGLPSRLHRCIRATRCCSGSLRTGVLFDTAYRCPLPSAAFTQCIFTRGYAFCRVSSHSSS